MFVFLADCKLSLVNLFVVQSKKSSEKDGDFFLSPLAIC